MPEQIEETKKQKQLGRSARLLIYGVAAGLVILAMAMTLDRYDLGKYALIDSHAQTAHENAPNNAALNVTQIAAPTTATVFGERIPLENWEVRERFEREFYYNFSNADQILLEWKRAQRLFPNVDKALAAAGLPADLKFLAVAESGLKNVKSPANANGFWQFIPSTGMTYGLRVDDLIDERLDPDRATAAAIKYFQKMKAALPTWTLVAAGYNMGEDNVRQAMDWQHQSSYWNLFLNDETMRYVFRVAAIKELLENGQKYGLNFAKTTPFRDVQTKPIPVQGPIGSISDWAQQQGYAYKDIKILNPWIVGRSLPGGSYTIKLPIADEDRATVANP
jgi:membrane-bound lytic murein transglycosylase D